MTVKAPKDPKAHKALLERMEHKDLQGQMKALKD